MPDEKRPHGRDVEPTVGRFVSSTRAGNSYARSLGSLPQTLVIVGEDDTLCDDGIDIANRVLKACAPVQLHIGEKMPHGFHMQHGLVPQAAAAAEQVILNFLKTSSLP